MDVKQYYRKVREVETTLAGPYVLVVSLETSDGGKAGILSEVQRFVAARMIVEGRAALAGEEQKKSYQDQQSAAKRAAQKAEMARRLQVAIITEPDVEAALSVERTPGPSGK